MHWIYTPLFIIGTIFMSISICFTGRWLWRWMDDEQYCPPRGEEYAVFWIGRIGVFLLIIGLALR